MLIYAYIQQNQLLNTWSVRKKSRYNVSTGKLLSAIDVPVDAVLCRDVNCRVHIYDIDVFFERIITCLKCAEKECVPSKHAHPNYNSFWTKLEKFVITKT